MGGKWGPSGVCRWFAFALLAIGAHAHASTIELATLDASGAGFALGDVLDGTYDAQFRVLPGPHARLRGGGVHWLRIAIDFDATGSAGSGRVLVFDRVALQRITVYFPRNDGAPHDGFFAPVRTSGLGPDSYAFAIPDRLAGRQVVYAAVDSATGVSLAPRVLTTPALHARERTIHGTLSAIYAAIVVLMLSALTMVVALRDRAYLSFVVLAGGTLLLVAMLNGHVYHWPALRWLGWWGGNGLLAVALACSAAALRFTRQFLDLSIEADSSARLARRLGQVMLVLAGVALLNLAALATMLQLAAAVLIGVGVLLTLAMARAAARRGAPLARSYALVWIVLALAIAARAAVAFGLLPPSVVTLYAFQASAAFGLFLMSMALADRVIEFRRERDRAHQLQQKSDATLLVEQVRRQFADDLRGQLRATTPEGDLEWLAFKRLLGSLRQVLPQQASAVVAYGYHGIDLLMTDPLDSKESFARVLAARGGTLKSLCRSRKTVQVTFEEARRDGVVVEGEDPVQVGGLFAVIPMPVPVPGWGALLIERSGSEPFAAHELKLAADFTAQAVAATDEAASQAELRRKAEIDPLTGAGNRRAGDTLLEQTLERALADRVPYSLLMVDLDHFKQLNEKHGHAVGDDCLRRAADAIRQAIGSDDMLVRHGGEEFLVILPGLAPERARQMAERIRQAVLAIRFDSPAGPVRFTVSIGVAGRLPGEDQPAPIVERAERALYTAKRNGRNQVQSAQAFGFGASPTEEEPPVSL